MVSNKPGYDFHYVPDSIYHKCHKIHLPDWLTWHLTGLTMNIFDYILAWICAREMCVLFVCLFLSVCLCVCVCGQALFVPWPPSGPSCVGVPFITGKLALCEVIKVEASVPTLHISHLSCYKLDQQPAAKPPSLLRLRTHDASRFSSYGFSRSDRVTAGFLLGGSGL